MTAQINSMTIRHIATLRDEIDRLRVELKSYEHEVRSYLIATGSSRIVFDDGEAVLRPGEPSFDYDGLLAALGEHLSSEDRTRLLPFDRPCRMCHGTGREPGVVNGNAAKQIRTYAPKDGVNFKEIIDAHTVRAEPTLQVKVKT